MAQWIRLCLPFCPPGSSPKHTINELELEKNGNKTRSGRDWPIFFKKTTYFQFLFTKQ